MSVRIQDLTTLPIDGETLQKCQISLSRSCIRVIGFNPEYRVEVLHSYRTAVSRFEIILEMIESGYRFDDEKSEKYQDILKQALGTLKSVSGTLTDIFDDPESYGDTP